MVWLNSRGSLSTEDQQYEPWLRAPWFNGAKKAVVEVLGFDKPESGRVHSTLSSERQTKDTVTAAGEKQYREVSADNGQAENKEEFAHTSIDAESSGATVQ